MVAIRPFRALRYDPASAPDLSRVIAPPYDVIAPEEQAQLYQASPYNVIRLILGTQSPSDTPQDNRYTRAARDFNAWRSAGVLRRDETPGLYLVEHQFAIAGTAACRLGFIALLELQERMDQAVYRHEATLSAPKEDRTKLLEAVPANLEPIFCIYPDEGAAVQTALREAGRKAPPVAEATLHGERLRLWAITEASVLDLVAARLASVAVLIADGHHRFEVSCAQRGRYGALMSYFVSMEEPALRVQPIHRLVHSDRAADLGALTQLCELEPAQDLGAVLSWLERTEGQGRFGYCDGRALYQATVKPAVLARWLMTPPVPLPVAALDVSVLHHLVLPGLGVNGTGVRYAADAARVVEDVKSGAANAAWLLRPIPLPQVYALASQGLLLSPKSTYFYPKVPSGLTINPWSAD